MSTESVKLTHPVSKILDIVGDMKHQGYRLGVDFDFSYHPYQFDQFSGDETLAYTEFLFYNNSLASWFVIKYS
jgi:hypothetical protein